MFFYALGPMKNQYLILLLCMNLFACSSLIEKKAASFGDNLTQSMLNFEDPATVAGAMPTFIILIDSLARDKEASSQSKLAASQLIGAYSSAFVHDEKRQKALADLAFTYAKEGSCKAEEKWCGVDKLSPKDFNAFVQKLEPADVPIIYSYAGAWLGYINANSDDWNVIASLQHCKILLEKIVELDENYDHAGAHLYLGAIAAALPEAIGGKPEIAKAHFDRAIELTKGQSLLVKVEYARRYARATFNKNLHHELLIEVLAADPKSPGLTLMNTWAQQQATELLATENDYFF